jgi:hypothetical protein
LCAGWCHSRQAIELMEKEVKFVKLQDGRRVAYREQGVTWPEVGRRSLLVIHGIASSRLASMPGIGSV